MNKILMVGHYCMVMVMVITLSAGSCNETKPAQEKAKTEIREKGNELRSVEPAEAKRATGAEPAGLTTEPKQVLPDPGADAEIKDRPATGNQSATDEN
jgi:hypothetical protein